MGEANLGCRIKANLALVGGSRSRIRPSLSASDSRQPQFISRSGPRKMSRQWLGYPEPNEQMTASLPRIAPQNLASILLKSTEAQDVVLVDVRRADLTGYMLVGSVNLPAHTFYPSRYTIANMLASKSRVIFYCASSRGRGPRCAGWMQQVLVERNSKTQVVVLDGGAKSFVEKYDSDGRLVIRLPDEVTE